MTPIVLYTFWQPIYKQTLNFWAVLFCWNIHGTQNLWRCGNDVKCHWIEQKYNKSCYDFNASRMLRYNNFYPELNIFKNASINKALIQKLSFSLVVNYSDFFSPCPLEIFWYCKTVVDFRRPPSWRALELVTRKNQGKLMNLRTWRVNCELVLGYVLWCDIDVSSTWISD